MSSKPRSSSCSAHASTTAWLKARLAAVTTGLARQPSDASSRDSLSTASRDDASVSSAADPFNVGFLASRRTLPSGDSSLLTTMSSVRDESGDPFNAGFVASRLSSVSSGGDGGSDVVLRLARTSSVAGALQDRSAQPAGSRGYK